MTANTGARITSGNKGKTNPLNRSSATSNLSPVPGGGGGGNRNTGSTTKKFQSTGM